jgi:hypothetical protein
MVARLRDGYDPAKVWNGQGTPVEIGKIAIAATAMIEAGDVEAAQTQIVDRLSQNPEDPALWAEAGFFLQRIGSDEESLGLLERAWVLGSRDIRIPYYMGVAYRGLGQTAEAEAAFRQALALDDRYGDAWHHLGVALAHQGKFTEAIESFQAAEARLAAWATVSGAPAFWPATGTRPGACVPPPCRRISRPAGATCMARGTGNGAASRSGAKRSCCSAMAATAIPSIISGFWSRCWPPGPTGSR